MESNDMKKRIIFLMATLLTIVSCGPTKEKVYKFGEWDNNIMVTHSSKDCKFDVSLTNNPKQFAFGYLKLGENEVYNFESSDLTFVDSQNETITFDDFGIFVFENSFKERIVSIYYSETIHKSITLNNSYIRLNVCQRYYSDLDRAWNNA